MRKETVMKHVIYWILPLLLLLPCVLLYFPDPDGTGKYIAPAINCEFGIIENLQLLFIALIIITAIKGVKQSLIPLEKYAWLLITALSVFIFLEEIDYGLHYYEYFTGKSKDQVAYEFMVEGKIRNVHNIGKINSVIKFTVYVLMVLLFAVLPLLPQKWKQQHPWLHYIAPSRWILTTGGALLVLNAVTSWLNNMYDVNGTALAGNLSEFEETMTYYLFLLYSRELVAKRWPVPAHQWRETVRSVAQPTMQIQQEQRNVQQ